jgi:hypothetical protein
MLTGSLTLSVVDSCMYPEETNFMYIYVEDGSYLVSVLSPESLPIINSLYWCRIKIISKSQ